MLFHVVNAAKQAKWIDEIVVVSPHKVDVPDGIKNHVHYGNENDVLGRYYEASKLFPCDYVVRLTADCPLLDPFLIDLVIAWSIGYDYGSNVLAMTFPDGMDVEVMSSGLLEYLHLNTNSMKDREHVTTLIRKDPVEQMRRDLLSIEAYDDQSGLKISVDTEEDLKRVREYACQR